MPTQSSKASSRQCWMAPHLTVFFASACIMVMELVAGRIIARHVGISLYTWTAIIGIVMAGISLGNHLGGRAADRFHPRRILPWLFFGAALACLLILPLNASIGSLDPMRGLNWPLRIFLHVAFVFLVPSVLLGMFTPVVVKMALNYKRAEGRTIGGVFASGVAGSLLGTFAAGYYLVMWWAASTIILVSAAGLALIGAVYLVLPVGTPHAGKDAPDQMAASRPGPVSWRGWAPAAMTVFLSNAAFMIFELAALRVIAREFGNSLYTWTTVIGTVLAGVSLGNYLGGRMADRSPSRRTLSMILAVGAVLVLLTPGANEFIIILRDLLPYLGSLSLPMQITVQVAALCFLPCVAIGMISPVVTRRLLLLGKAPGASVGIIYAWGAIGAVFGTFLAGFWLLQWMGSLSVIALVAFLLAGAGLCYAPRQSGNWGLAALCALALVSSLTTLPGLDTLGGLLRVRTAPDAHVVYEDESQYSYIAVTHDRQNNNIRRMTLDRLVHTQVDLRDPTKLLYAYEKTYSALMSARHPMPQPVRALVLGGGGYAYPRYLEVGRPGSEIIVAEIDPAVTEAAYAAMGLPRDTGIEIRHRDARNVVDDLLQAMATDTSFRSFDYIFGDSLNDYTVPFHLTTLEFKQRLRALLTDDGVYLLNMIDILNEGAFLAAIVHTCRQVFEQVVVFSTGNPASQRDTFVVVCGPDTPLPSRLVERFETDANHVGHLVGDDVLDALIERHGGVVLTDDYAPVENLLAPVVRKRLRTTE